MDGLLTVMASIAVFAMAAKGHKVALNAVPRKRLEGMRQSIASAGLKGLEAVTKHPTFKTLQKAFVRHPTVGPGPLEQVFREVDPTSMGLLQDLWTVSQLSDPGADFLSAIRDKVLTQYDVNIPQLAAGRYRRTTLDDLQKIASGSKYKKQIEKVLGPGGRNLDNISQKLGISREKMGELRLDFWHFTDPTNTQDTFNLRSINPLRIFDRLEQVTLGGIPLFRVRTDPRGRHMGTAHFDRAFEAGEETTNPILKLLSKEKYDKGELVVSNNAAWWRRNKDNPFELLDNDITKRGLELTSDPRRGQFFYMHHADRESINQHLYGVKDSPSTNLHKFSQWFGIDVGARGGYARGHHGTVMDDLLRAPYTGETASIRRSLIKRDPTGLMGSVTEEDLLSNRILDIGSRSPVTEASGAKHLYVASADPITSGMNWLNIMTARPLYLMSKFGLNVRPGRGPVGTALKAATLGAGVYMGAEALRYADYALFDLPSKGIRATVGATEYARQYTLEHTGMRGAIESIEEETPGLFSSPLSSAVKIALGVVAGVAIGKKFGAPKRIADALEKVTDKEAKGLAGTVYDVAGRYVSPLAANEVMGSKVAGGAIVGGVAGFGAGLFTSVGDIKATPEDVAERFRGDRKTPYRASAGWMLGRDPFAGGNIRFHRESHYSTFGSAYKDKALYGTQTDKWRYGSWLPTLQNWGGARRLLNPYYVEDRHHDARPYPVSAGHFGEFPIVGTTLESTVGTLLKPTRYRDPYGGAAYSGHAAAQMGGGGGTSVAVRTAGEGGSHIAGTGGGTGALHNINQLSHDVAQAALYSSYAGVSGFRVPTQRDMDWMGFGYGDMLPRDAAVHTGLAQTMGVQTRNLEEFFGLRGFQMQMLRENIFGHPYPILNRPMLAQSGTMTSTARSYYDIEPGGLLGMCFHGDTNIDTDSGWKKIRDIEIGERVMSDGVYRSVVRKFTRAPDKLLKMKVSNVSTEIVATPEHVFPVYKFYPCHEKNSTPCVPGSRQFCSSPGKLQKPKGKPEYRSVCGKNDKSIHLIDTPISEIDKNDYLVIPGPKPLDNKLVIDLSDFTDLETTETYIYNRASKSYAEIYEILDKDPYTTRSDIRASGYSDKDSKEAIRIYNNASPKRFDRYVDIDEDMAWVMGWWIAEGSVEPSGRISFSLHEDEKHYAQQIGEIITKKFGNSYSIVHDEDKGICLRVQCIPLAKMFAGLFGIGAHHKHIPPRIKTMPVKELTQLFRGVVEGDGWYNETKSGYGSVSDALCRDIFQIGIALGLKGSLVLNYKEQARGYYPQGTPKKECVRSYISWGGESANRVFNIMTGQNVPYEGRRDSRSFIHNGDLYVRVISVEECPVNTDAVYDLEIEDVHYYTANMVLAHNSEYPRRLLLRPRKQPEVNFIPNVSPRWLPGTLSEFERDRAYPIDFSRGDPFASIPQGEARLPGPGYEVLHNLHGRNFYDPLDAFLILSDVAPYSQAYTVMHEEVKRMIRKGDVDSDWIRKYQIAIEQAETRADFRVFHSRKYDGQQDMTIRKVLSPTDFETVERPGVIMRMAGTKLRDMDAMIAEYQRQGLGPEEAHSRAAAAQGEMHEFLKSMEGRRIQGAMLTRAGGYTEVESEEFLRRAEELEVETDRSDLRDQGIIGRAYTESGKHLGEAGFALGGVLGWIKGGKKSFEIAQKGSLASKVGWAGVTAAGTGLFGGWMENKFTGDFTAIEHYKRHAVYGTGYADWASPVASFLSPWMHNIGRTAVSMLGTDYTPAYRQKQRDIEEYFDKLKHAKNMMLLGKGMAFEDLEPTMTGLNYAEITARTPGVVRAIPSSERNYFRQFAAEIDPSVQSDIISNVPEYMRSIYLSIWKNENEGKSFENPELDHAYAEYVQPLIDTPARERVSDYFSRREAPGPESGVWHPAISVDAVKFKAIEAMGGSPHTHGLYSTEGARIDAFQPDIRNIGKEVASSLTSTASRQNFNQTQKIIRGHADSELYNAYSFMFRSKRGRIDIIQDDNEMRLDTYSRMHRESGIW
jgi:intein/homing endonuclease